jgi:hypothetical protein
MALGSAVTETYVGNRAGWGDQQPEHAAARMATHHGEATTGFRQAILEHQCFIPAQRSDTTRPANESTAHGTLQLTGGSHTLAEFRFKTNPKSDSSVEKIARQQEKIWKKIHGSRKSNLEHFSLLTLLPNLHEFWIIQKILSQSWFDWFVII